MSKIKFRGKRVDNGERVVGSFIPCGITGKAYIFPPGSDAHETDEVGMEGCLTLFAFEVDPATVGQFIRRKDKNKKEIYSGDIVICNYGRWHEEPRGLTRIGIVEYSDVHCGFVIRVLNSKVKVSFPDVTKSTVEIIGNVTDNPKLLEVQP